MIREILDIQPASWRSNNPESQDTHETDSSEAHGDIFYERMLRNLSSGKKKASVFMYRIWYPQNLPHWCLVCVGLTTKPPLIISSLHLFDFFLLLQKYTLNRQWKWSSPRTKVLLCLMIWICRGKIISPTSPCQTALFLPLWIRPLVWSASSSSVTPWLLSAARWRSPR